MAPPGPKTEEQSSSSSKDHSQSPPVQDPTNNGIPNLNLNRQPTHEEIYRYFSAFGAAFGAAFQPGAYAVRADRTIGNPAPMGLAGFALTTFLLSLNNLGARGVSTPNLVVGPAFAYGGLVQLLAGMWYGAIGGGCGQHVWRDGGFWISFGIIFTPGGFGIVDAYGGTTGEFYNALGLYLIGWFIFSFLLWILTIRSTFAFSFLLFTVWLTYLMLGIAYMDNSGGANAAANLALTRAGGAFGIIASFMAWWNMLAGIADESNSFFQVPCFTSRGRRVWSRKAKDEEKND